MRNLIIAIVLLLGSIDAQAHFEPGQKLNVLAQSGLKLRTAPVNGHTIQVIPYGAELTVVDSEEYNCSAETIEWISGKWIQVSYNGETGYVFDGFLSDFPIPEYDFELNQIDMGLIYPLESWVEYRLVETGQKMDTLVNDLGGLKTIQHFTDGKWMKEDINNIHKVELHLVNVRIMDAYQLLQAMYDDPFKQRSFRSKSIFIENGEGEVEFIKIPLDEYVTIRQISEDHIRVRIISSESGCE
jgi:hypothetical protein